VVRPKGFRERRQLMDRARVARTLTRMATEVLERHSSLDGLTFVGIRSRGVPLAKRLAQRVAELAGAAPLPVGALDITLYRDDLTMIALHPIMKGTDIPFSIDGASVVLVDDVLFTGRTVRAALQELIDLGRPDRIELAVLVDRGHRELPIRADYVGKTVTTARDENVQVLLQELDGADRVALLDRAPEKKPRARAPRKLSARRSTAKTGRRKKAPRR
jgi:pyrimidine operon attenuation protein/uracil phosphoribosyltransferase